MADDGGLGWGEADCVGCVVVDGFAGSADGACDLGAGHTGVCERPDAGEFGRGDGAGRGGGSCGGYAPVDGAAGAPVAVGEIGDCPPGAP